MSPNNQLTRKDFVSDQDVRWCPGCGDYAILAAVQRTLPDIGVTKDQTVFVSGIGCSSRFPYYMNTYGFHTIHGRAPAIATGLKLANPQLDVWVITGDGDGLSIGGNHLLHVLRRNVDLKILLFNNRIYGLTKGQYSPTSLTGQVSPSTPFGSVDQPVWPCMFALGSNARFVARAYDTTKRLPEIFKRAHEHRGASFMEILQNCPVYNDAQFEDVTDRKTAEEHQLWVTHGEPLVFGKDQDKGIRLRPGTMDLEVVQLGNGLSEKDLLVHDETNRTQAFLLAQLQMPVAMGVLFCSEAESYDHGVREQIDKVRERKGTGDLGQLLQSGHTWRVD